MAPKVTIITPSIRKEGLAIVRDSMINQTFQDYEWIVCSPFEWEECALWIKDDFEGGFWGLNRAYNAMFAKAQGRIIISWQDFIWLPPDALEKMVKAVEATGAVVSGVGDQYSRIGEYGKPEVKIWADPRKNNNHGSFYEVNWNDAEFNFCGFPKDFAFMVGGFDEQLDFLGYGGDQMSFCERLNDIGISFFLDQTNESFTLRHTRDDFGGQENWDANHTLFNGEYDKRREELKEKGVWPCLTYL